LPSKKNEKSFKTDLQNVKDVGGYLWMVHGPFLAEKYFVKRNLAEKYFAKRKTSIYSTCL